MDPKEKSEQPTTDESTKEAEAEKGYSELYGWVPYGITSLADLDAYNDTQEKFDELRTVTGSMMAIADNIFMDDSIPDKTAAMADLANEFAAHVGSMMAVDKTLDADYLHPHVEAESKSNPLQFLNPSKPGIISKSANGEAVLYRAKDGLTYLYGRPTNRWRDRDYYSSPENGGEIITDAAHEEFSKFLDENPSEMPEIWVMHEELTAFDAKATWHDYADGFMHFLWPIQPDEVPYVKNFIANYSAGMSHGFQVLERDDANGLIEKYRMHEASLVPVELAANVWANFEVKEMGKGFTPEKREILLNTFGDDWVLDKEKANETTRAQLDAHIETKAVDGSEPKGHEMDEKETTAPDVEPTDAEEPTNSEAQTEPANLDEAGVVEAMTAMTEHFTEVLGAMTEQVAGLSKRLDEVEKGINQDNKTSGMTLASLTAAFKNGHSVIGSESAHVPSTASLAKQQPAATSSNHVLASLFE